MTEFSKKTGDYPSLSAVDLKLMGLVYQLEKEHVGTEHLRTQPQSKVCSSPALHLNYSLYIPLVGI